MKVAVPVKDDTLEIMTRTGRAPFYAIFEVNDNDYELLELRENLHSHEHEHEDGEITSEEEYSQAEVRQHRKQLQNISDVDAILVRGLGPNMKGALELENIKVIRVNKKDGDFAGDVIKKYLIN